MAEKVKHEFSPDTYAKFMLMCPGDSFNAKNKDGVEYTFIRDNHPLSGVEVRKKA